MIDLTREQRIPLMVQTAADL